MKKILCIVMVLCLVFVSVPISTLAYDDLLYIGFDGSPSFTFNCNNKTYSNGNYALALSMPALSTSDTGKLFMKTEPYDRFRGDVVHTHSDSNYTTKETFKHCNLMLNDDFSGFLGKDFVIEGSYMVKSLVGLFGSQISYTKKSGGTALTNPFCISDGKIKIMSIDTGIMAKPNVWYDVQVVVKRGESVTAKINNTVISINAPDFLDQFVNFATVRPIQHAFVLNEILDTYADDFKIYSFTGSVSDLLRNTDVTIPPSQDYVLDDRTIFGLHGITRDELISKINPNRTFYTSCTKNSVELKGSDKISGGESVLINSLDRSKQRTYFIENNIGRIVTDINDPNIKVKVITCGKKNNLPFVCVSYNDNSIVSLFTANINSSDNEYDYDINNVLSVTYDTIKCFAFEDFETLKPVSDPVIY